MGAMQAKVSVIIPTYNRAELLPQTLLSAQTQALEQIEIIVCDDASTDRTPEIMEAACALDSRIVYSRSETNGGVSAARNRGLERARGEFIQLLDSDDLIEREKLRFQVEMLEADSRLDAAACQTLTFRRFPRDAPFVWNTFVGPDPLGRLLETEVVWSSAAPLYRKSVFERWGGFDESLGPGEDLEMAIRQLAFGMRIALHGHLLAHYRVSSPGGHAAQGRLKLVETRGRAVIAGAGHLLRAGRLDEDSARRIAVSIARSAWEFACLGRGNLAMEFLQRASEALTKPSSGDGLRRALEAWRGSDGDADHLRRAMADAGLDWAQRKPWWLRHRVENEPIEPLPRRRLYVRRGTDCPVAPE